MVTPSGQRKGTSISIFWSPLVRLTLKMHHVLFSKQCFVKLFKNVNVLHIIINCYTLKGSCKRKVVCYYTCWANDRMGAKYLPENIDVTLCTHIVYAFATLWGGLLTPYKDAGNYAALIQRYSFNEVSGHHQSYFWLNGIEDDVKEQTSHACALEATPAVHAPCTFQKLAAAKIAL